MHLHDSFHLRRDCVDCPSAAPSCSCGVGFQCIITSRSCAACPTASCVAADEDSTTTKSGGVSSGAIAGAVIGVLFLLAASVALLIWYRRRQRAAQSSVEPKVDAKPDVPARAEAVLSRPDPVEKPQSPSPQEPESVRMYSVMSNSTINLDPQAKYSNTPSHQTRPSQRESSQSNPFTDTHSIQTTSASTQSTNVIPIALVPHGSVSSSPPSPTSDSQSGASSNAPARPVHTPELGLRFNPLSSGLNLEHVNVSKDSFRPPNAPYAQSQASGISGFSSRDSVMTTGSFASDVLYEAPQIVTNAGRVNLSKAEVVSVQGTLPGSPMSSASGMDNQNLKPSTASRISKSVVGRSPLAQTSFGPADSLSVSESEAEGQEIEYHPHRNNPFGDEHSPRLITSNSISTFGGSTPVPIPSTASPNGQYQHDRGDDSGTNTESPATARPVSTLTQAASIIGAEIGGATVVRLNSTGSAKNRLTSAKLVTPTSAPLRTQDDRLLQQQQAQALAAARARAVASGLPMPGIHSSSSSTSSTNGINASLHSRRVSEASVMSAGADSLLESFTFVPPSPISSRPPRSPLGAQSPVIPPVPPLPNKVQNDQEEQTTRQVQGLSTASTGIEGYDFRLDSGQAQASMTSSSVPSTNGSAARGETKPPPSATKMNGDGTMSLNGRQRASLDTLALTADLSAFPLNFDEGRGSFGVSK